jgi:hypothetical protein
MRKIVNRSVLIKSLGLAWMLGLSLSVSAFASAQATQSKQASQAPQTASKDAAQVVFVAGNVKNADKPLALNSMVSEGAQISTGADGFVYLKTIDNGFLIVRPNSTIRIVSYQIDKLKPENTRIKLELISGVARSISGEAVKLSRQNFRFNTPVAAIGVRGTDFTVFTDQAVSRVSVLSGGVVVSGFGGACTPVGTGPCEGASSVELYAAQQGKLLQITKDQIKPSIFNGNTSAPDQMSPPRNDEPNRQSSVAVPVVATVILPNNAVTDPLKNSNLAEQLAINQAEQAAAKLQENSITWGRWSVLLGLSTTLDPIIQSRQQAKLITGNPYFAIYQSKASEWQVPVVGSMGFALKGGEAYVIDSKNNVISSAGMENGSLRVDFATATFNTSFDLVARAERFAMQSQGTISADGKLFGNPEYAAPTNMAVSGVITQEKGGTASYLFQRRLDENRETYGVTYWSKK